jgi:hypothetical protein
MSTPEGDSLCSLVEKTPQLRFLNWFLLFCNRNPFSWEHRSTPEICNIESQHCPQMAKKSSVIQYEPQD